MDLSILIPARNEMFLAKTVEDILSNIEGNTEIIVVLDGAWANPPIPDDPRVTVLYHNQSVGQRAATNEAARLSKAKYVMKCDAHVAFDKGFDIKMMNEMHDDWTMVPRLYNLHAFDWECKKCKNRTYQGPTPTSCNNCDNQTDFERVMVWKPRLNRKTDFMRFDSDLHFQYWGEFEKRPDAQGDIANTLSLLGACWMLTRDKYWELEICDEEHGSWGQQGTEVACKTWLSGGRLVVNKKTWYSHMFRTQGGDFGFPYPQSQRQIEKSRAHSRKLFLENTWPKAIHDLDWLIQKFSPVPGWEDVKVDEKKEIEGATAIMLKKLTKGVIYYTDNELEEPMMKAVQQQILRGIKEKHIVSVSLKPITFGKNIVLPLERGYLTMAKQILAGLESSNADIIFFCEHDVLYHPSHFDFIPSKKDAYYYNTNVWRSRLDDGHSLYTDNLQQLSGLCAYRETLLQHYKERVRRIETEGFSRAMGFEPGTHNRKERVDNLSAFNYVSKLPNIDIRHGKNLTASRWKKEDFRDQRYTKGWTESEEVPGWGNVKEAFDKLLRI